MYLQPIKNDDPKLDFYTMYEQERLEYDIGCMQKYNEDLNNTLIFVRFWVIFSVTALTTFSGWSVLRGQKPTSAQSSSTSTNPLFPTKTLLPPQFGMVPSRDGHDFKSSLRKSVDVAVGRVHRDPGQVVAEQIPLTLEDRWPNAVATASKNSMAWRNDCSACSLGASPPCSRSRSSLPVACQHTCGRSTRLPHASSSPSPLSAFSSTSELWPPERPHMSARSKRRHR